MKTVILCGGKGTRIRDTSEIPKPLMPIGGRPILWHIMKTYAYWGFDDFVLCLGYKGWAIKEFFLNYRAMTTDLTINTRSSDMEYHTPPEDDWRVTLAETGLESMTGYRLLKAMRYVGTETFMFTYGDGVSDIDLRALLGYHRSHGRIGTMTGVRPGSRFGEIQADGNQVTSFAEKPQASAGLINGGFCVFEPEFFKYIDDDPSVVLEQEPLRRLTKDRQLMVFEHSGYWQPMDTYREYELLNRLWNTGTAPWKRWA